MGKVIPAILIILLSAMAVNAGMVHPPFPDGTEAAIIIAPPVAPQAQWIVGDSAREFAFLHITAGKGGNQVEWATEGTFENSKIIKAPATIRIKVMPGQALVIWLRSRDSVSGNVSEPVTTLARVVPMPAQPVFGSNLSYVPCGHDLYMRSLYLSDPQSYKSVIEADNRVIEDAAHVRMQTDHQRLAPTQGQTYVIPVVFHVICVQGDTEGSPTDVSYARIQSEIDKMNASYSSNYPGYNGQINDTPAINTGVRFCLANNTYPTTVKWTNPNEPGVMRYYTNDPNALNPAANDPGTWPDVTNLSGFPTNFPPNNYFNIWVLQGIQSGMPGLEVEAFCTFPYSIAGGTPSLDGMFVQAHNIGDNSVPGNNFAGLASYEDEGKVPVHEAGHFLGLYHPFQPNPSGNNTICASAIAPAAYNDGDYCLDTKPCIELFGGCDQLNTCTGAYDYPNATFMNYLDQDCVSNFSSDEVNLRMYPSLTDSTLSRYNLWQPANISLTGVNCGACIMTAAIRDSFKGQCPGINSPVQFSTDTGSFYCANSWTWSFPGSSSVSSTTSPNPIVKYSNTGTYKVYLTACKGTGPCVKDSITINVESDSIVAGIVPLNATVCSGSSQVIQIQITSGGTAPYVVTLSNGAVAQPIYYGSGTYVLQNITESQTITIASINGNPCPAIYTGQANINVIECCVQNLVFNGDFSKGDSGSYTPDLIYNSEYQSCGEYYVYDVTKGSPGWFSWPTLQDLGNSYAMDEYPAAEENGFTLDWAQDSIPVDTCTDYIFSFDAITGVILADGVTPIVFEMALVAPDSTVVFSGVFNDPVDSQYNEPYSTFWEQGTFTWNSGNVHGNDFTLQIRELPLYSCSGGDVAIDNITMSKVTNLCNPNPKDTFNICKGQCANIGSNLPAEATVTWTPSLGLNNSNIVNPCASPQDTTVYIAKVYANTGTQCGTSLDTAIVNVDNLYTNNNNPDTSVCTTNPAVPLTGIVITGGKLPYTYNWGPSAGLTGTKVLSPGATMPGLYVLTVTDGSNCSSTVAEVVTLDSIVQPVNASSNSPICPGQTLQLNAIAFAGASYQWSGPGGYVGYGQNPVITDFSAGAAGEYYVTVTTPCSTSHDSTLVKIGGGSVSFTARSNSPVCAGDSLHLWAPGVAGGSYSWTGPQSFSSQDSSLFIPDMNNSKQGTYYVEVTSPGCGAGTDSVDVKVNSLPLVKLPSNTYCYGDTVTLNAGSGFASYLWCNGSTQSSITIFAVDTTIVSCLTITDTNGCKYSLNITSTFLPKPAPVTFTQAGDSLICNNNATAYQWFLNGDTISTGTGQTLVITGQGIYEVAATDSFGCVTLSGTAAIYPAGINNIQQHSFDVTLLPNPASGHISVSSTQLMDAFVVHNIAGQEILKVENIQTLKNDIDLGGWPSGIYILQATKGQQQVIRRFTVFE